jgi:hypothetical protein
MKIFFTVFLAISMFMQLVMGVAILGILIGVVSPEIHEAIISVLKS